jgi:hypothetical protein
MELKLMLIEGGQLREVGTMAYPPQPSKIMEIDGRDRVVVAIEPKDPTTEGWVYLMERALLIER